MAAGAGKVALVTDQTSLGCNGGSAPCSAAQLARIKDLVGYGNANFFEGAGSTSTLSATLAALRNGAGCQDTDNNNADFAGAGPQPRNTATALNPCGGDAAPEVSSTTPADNATGVLVGANIDVTFSEAVNAAAGWYTITCTGSGVHTATVSGGPITFTLNPDADFAELETCTVEVIAENITDQDGNDPPDLMAANYVFDFSTEGDVCNQPFTPIYSIQGSGSSAAITGNVTTEGVVVGDFEGPTSGRHRGLLSSRTPPATAIPPLATVSSSSRAAPTTAWPSAIVVRVTGFARERFNQTAINGSNSNTSPVDPDRRLRHGQLCRPRPT